MTKIKVGVTGTGSLVGQAIIKAIKNSSLHNDICIVGFDYFKDTVGSYWTVANYVLPDILKNNIKKEDWLQKVIETIRKEKIKFLFIGLDFELSLFAKYREYIENISSCRVIVSDREVIKVADDKYLTYFFLKEHKLPYPETALPCEFNKKKISFPCIVKPRFGSRSRGVVIVKGKAELKESLSQIDNPLIQEYVGSPESEYTCGSVCLDHAVKEIIILRRELKDGNTHVAYLNFNTPKVIYEYVYRIADILKPFGACNFQLRINEDGVPNLFEINARHSGTTYMRALFGFNEVEYILRHLLGLRQRKFRLREGVIKRYFEETFIEV